MSSDFGYVNARVRGMSSRLLGAETFQAALAAEDFRGFVSVLAQSPYGSAYEEEQSRVSGLPAVDRAIAADFHATTRSMLSFSDGAPRRMIAALLRRYDLDDLKAVARALHSGKEGATAEAAVTGAGDLRPDTVRSLLQAPDLPSAAQALSVTKHPLAVPFLKAARRYAQDGELLAFEVALDRAHYAALAEQADGESQAFQDQVRREIDATNLRTALKLAGREADAAGLFLDGGRELSRDAYLRLATEGFAALQSVASGSFEAVGRSEDLGSAERAIRAVLDAAARRAATRDPLGIGIVIRYLRAKEAEGAKLRLLARGAFYRVPRKDLEKELGRA